MHFVTNGCKRFSKTNSTDTRQRVPLIYLYFATMDFTSIVLMQIRWPIEPEFSQVCYYIISKVRIVKWEYWSWTNYIYSLYHMTQCRVANVQYPYFTVKHVREIYTLLHLYLPCAVSTVYPTLYTTRLHGCLVWTKGGVPVYGLELISFSS